MTQLTKHKSVNSTPRTDIKVNNNSEPPDPSASYAVVVKNAMKTYKGAKSPVLENFNMTVEKGTIYSLLGSSGCGKTTILSCIVGLSKIDEGQIEVFGSCPGTKESGLPGYMPQDVCLYPEFTISEALRYFGIIYGLTNSEIKEKQDFLLKLLDLPTKTRAIGTLSGGQRRRVSFACALIHEPKLLILDEPTVGVDPLLRLRIWDYLFELVSTKQTTVIITTHYHLEATKSHKVGLMRGGRLLIEKSPDALLLEHNSKLLQEIVLKLCRNDDMNRKGIKNSNTIAEMSFQPTNSISVASNHNLHTNRSVVYRKKRSVRERVEDFKENFSMSRYRMKALIMRNTVLLMRNVKFLLFILALPCLQMFNTCMTIGNDPTDLKFGVINFDMKCDTNYTPSCSPEFLSCRFLDFIPNNTLKLISFENEEDALREVEKGVLWGWLSFPANYSAAMFDRMITSGGDPSNETLDGSLIAFNMDMSSKQIAETIKSVFFFTYQQFVMDMYGKCDFDPRVGNIPLNFQDPVCGTSKTSFKEFIAPSSILAILFFFPLISGAVSYISDKKNGTLDRTLVAGVQTVEILAAYFVTEGIVLIIQTFLIFLIMIFGFNIVINGSAFWAFVLSALIGFSGLSLGFMISTMCTEEVQAVLLSLGLYFPNMLLGIPIFLQYVSYLVPCNLACVAMRSIVTRGWGILHPMVWPGFASTIAWICFYWVMTIIIHRMIAKK